MTDQPNASAAGSGPQFAIHRIYLKDASFETPDSPGIFRQQGKPEIKLQLNTTASELEDDLFEVVINITATATQNDKTGFLVEVQQAGIFTIKGFENQQKGHTLNVFCPETLLPFAREAISDLVVKGGFPPLLLAPINFEAHYAQAQSQEDAAKRSAQNSH
jgi:preprotein translocase subunit SecB